MKNKSVAPIVFLMVYLWILPVLASSPEEKIHVPELTESPKIDGVLDNPIWEQQSLKIENFTQFAPEQKKDTHTKNAGLFGLRSKKICILPSAVMKPIGKK